jgi:hypothetical protein
MNITQGQFQFLGILLITCVILIIGLAVILGSFAPKQIGLKAEFVKNNEELDKLLARENGNDLRKNLKTSLLIDTFAFIPAYFLLFSLMIWFLSRQEFSWSKYTVISAIVLAVLTVGFDLSENFHLYKCLEKTSESFAIISWSAIGKWICFFGTTAIISIAFWRKHWIAGIGILYLLSSIIGLILLYFVQKNPPDNDKITNLFQLPISLTITLTLIVGAFFIFFSANAEKIFNEK